MPKRVLVNDNAAPLYTFTDDSGIEVQFYKKYIVEYSTTDSFIKNVYSYNTLIGIISYYPGNIIYIKFGAERVIELHFNGNTVEKMSTLTETYSKVLAQQ
jgi:hypothetical protein